MFDHLTEDASIISYFSKIINSVLLKELCYIKRAYPVREKTYFIEILFEPGRIRTCDQVDTGSVPVRYMFLVEKRGEKWAR
jgi:hypothetical protein